MNKVISSVKKISNRVLAKKFNRILLVVALGFIVFLSFILLQKRQAELTAYSTQISDISRSIFIYSSEEDEGVLYKAQGEGMSAVTEFMEKGAPIRGRGQLLPPEFVKNSSIDSVTKDSDLPMFPRANTSKEHYSFKQYINGIEVYGASFIVHLKNKNEIYSVNGNVATKRDTSKQTTSEQNANEVAFQRGLSETQNVSDLKVIKSEKMIINFEILGLSDDPTNFITQAVQVDSESAVFSKRYYVSLISGEIIHEEQLILEAIQRNVYDCGGKSNPIGCPKVRSEGSATTSIPDVDNLYEYMGDIYDFYKTNYNRDGLDGKGSPLEGFVRIKSWRPDRQCVDSPNAYHSSAGYMAYCLGTVAKDVTAHEFGHGVIGSTVKLAQGYQYGALNESIADSFAASLDNNWTIGEGSVFGVIRNLSHPPAVDKGNGPHPDRVFASGYDCDSEEVHHNAGVQNKAFYLMTNGGNFNSCSITGIGLDKSKQILYKILASKYLPSTANFYNMYTAINQACADLYGANSDICREAKKAYEATEMDQQPLGSARGASCNGGKPKQLPTCAGQATSAPIPTATIVPGIPTATLAPGEPTPTSTPTPTITPFPTSSVKLPTTPTPTPIEYFKCEPDVNCIKSGKSIQLCPLICQPQ